MPAELFASECLDFGAEKEPWRSHRLPNFSLPPEGTRTGGLSFPKIRGAGRSFPEGRR